jgi:hypothetical protein
MIESCSNDFICCKYDTSDNSWEETACSCNNDNVFEQVAAVAITKRLFIPTLFAGF